MNVDKSWKALVCAACRVIITKFNDGGESRLDPINVLANKILYIKEIDNQTTEIFVSYSDLGRGKGGAKYMLRYLPGSLIDVCNRNHIYPRNVFPNKHTNKHTHTNNNDLFTSQVMMPLCDHPLSAPSHYVTNFKRHRQIVIYQKCIEYYYTRLVLRSLMSVLLNIRHRNPVWIV